MARNGAMQVFLVLLAGLALAVRSGPQEFPPAGWKNLPDPVASPYAVVGGEASTAGARQSWQNSLRQPPR